MKLKSRLTKVITSLVIASLTVVSLAGCSSKQTASKGPVTLTWWMVGPAPKDLNQVMAKLNPILQKDINVKLDMKFADYSNYNQKMNVIISSGTPYDIAFTSAWANNFTQQANKGAFLSLNDLLDKNGQDLKKLIPTNIWAPATVKGKIFGVPNYKDSGNGVFYVFAKQSVDAAKFNYKSATTLESLKPYLDYVKKNEPTNVPMPLTNTGFGGLQLANDYVLGNSLPVVVKLDDASGKVINPFTDPDTMSMLKTLHNYYEAGYINKDASTATTMPKYMPLSLAGGWPDAAQIWSASNGYQVVVQPAYPLYMTTSSIQGSMNAISANSKHGVEAIKLLNLVNSNAEVRNMIGYGIEGVNYKKTGDTSIKQLNTDYAPANFAIGTFFNGLYTVDPAPKTEWSNLKQFEATAKSSPVLGFQFDSSNTKVATQIALIQNVYNKYAARIITGSVDPVKAVPEMNAALNNAGLPDLIAQVQKQVDAWKTSK